MTLPLRGRALPALVLSSALFSAASAANVTVADPVQIVPAAQSYLPFEIWTLLFALTWICLGLSLWPGIEGRDMWAGLAAVLAAAVAWLTGHISFNSIHPVLLVDGDVLIQPVQIIIQPPYLGLLMIGVFLLAVVNAFRVIWLIYLKPIRDIDLANRGYDLTMER